MEYFPHCPSFFSQSYILMQGCSSGWVSYFHILPKSPKAWGALRLCRTVRKKKVVLKEEKWGGHMCIYFSPTECLSCLFYIHMWCVVCALVWLLFTLCEAILYAHVQYIIYVFGYLCLRSCYPGDVSLNPFHINKKLKSHGLEALSVLSISSVF